MITLSESPQDPQKRRTGSLLKWLLGAALLLVCLAAIFFLWVSSYAHSVFEGAGDEQVVVYIAPGSGFLTIKKTLVTHRVIADDIRFNLLARWMDAASKMRAGEYVFSPGLTHQSIIEKLAKGDVAYRPLTIPEGSSLDQIGALLADRGFDLEDFGRLVRDQDFIASLSLSYPTLEGYLFPDTYFITREQNLEDVVKMMATRFHEVFSALPPAGKQHGQLSPHQVVILASIVEKETAVAEERPLIAAVFLNRLKKKMKLQADPTVIYGIADFSGNLTRKDLRTPSPYNTYTLKGLPVGPIANPGRESLLAVLQPADVPYFYFVAKNDGSHYFSKTLREHNRAVQRFQKHKKKK